MFIVWVDVILIMVEDVKDIIISGDMWVGDVVSVYFGLVDLGSVVCLDGIFVLGVGIIC